MLIHAEEIKAGMTIVKAAGSGNVTAVSATERDKFSASGQGMKYRAVIEGQADLEDYFYVLIGRGETVEIK